MEQTPETKPASQPESPAGATSAVNPIAASMLQGLIRGAFFLRRGAAASMTRWVSIWRRDI